LDRAYLDIHWLTDTNFSGGHMLHTLKEKYYQLPYRFRHGYKTLKKTTAFIQEFEYAEKSAVLQMQFQRLQRIVNYAWKIKGYHELWETANFSPDKLKSIDDIQKIPFITKEIIRDNYKKFSIPKRWNVQYVSTGGSMGIPMGFYEKLENTHIENAFIYDIYKRVHLDFSIDEKSFTLRGKALKNIYESNPKGINLSSYNINETTVKEYIALIDKYKYRYLKAYPSSLYQVAKLTEDNKFVMQHHFKAIMLGSEPLFDFQKELIQRVFNAPIAHWYGHSEKAVLAANCEHSYKFHVYPQYGITEVVDKNGNYVKEGETGEIIGTSFWNFATPFVRYRTMDYAELGANKCAECGRNYQLLNRIEGREQDFVIDMQGNRITLTALIFAQHFICFGRIKQMQIKQTEKGKISVLVVPTKDYNEKDSEELLAKIKTAATGGLSVEIKVVDSIEPLRNGKVRFLDQRLDLTLYE